jgi:hypothetical protein
MAGYRNAPWHAVDIDPARSGFGPIGHMGYFKPKAMGLWKATLDWFDGGGHRAATFTAAAPDRFGVGGMVNTAPQ